MGLEDSVPVQIRPLITPYTEFWVRCNLLDMNGIGITEISKNYCCIKPNYDLAILVHDQMKEKIVNGQENPGQYVAILKYNSSAEDYTRLIKSSKNCRQFLQWKCKSASIVNPQNSNDFMTFWMNR